LAPARPRSIASRAPALFLGAVGFVFLVALLLSAGASVGSPAPGGSLLASGPSTHPGHAQGAAAAVSIVAVGPAPTEVTAGTPTAFAWQALDAQGARVPSFAVAAELTVADTANGSAAPAWVNSSRVGPLARAANGTFSVPAAAWNAGVLNLSLEMAVAVPVRVDLFGPVLPSTPAAMLVTVLPDLDALVLYNATHVENNLSGTGRTYSAFWHVRDRFGDPAPGAALIVEFTTGSSVNQTVVPVVGLRDGTSGAWVNVTVPGPGGASVAVLDEAGTVLLGPLPVPPVAAAASPSGPTLSPFALVAVALLAVGGFGGIGALLAGGRPRPAPAPTGEEEELRRLAEGRWTVVEIVREQGPLTLHDIEAAWSPPPAPPALADWVASLVTDGTLTASLDSGRPARFSLAARPTEKPRVTLDEDALAQGIARRDAAVEPDDAEENAP
jgi:hypothetical protein